ncbi:MAG: ParA family protein [Gammaproteobacteria bacterium]|nr:ParA family protein [Gammaproteobacteria bacterium]
MRTILVANAKGGCGKTTIATNLAAHYANEGAQVVLADFDPQRGSIDWLASRPSNARPIEGIDATDEGLRHLPRSADVLVMDAPARLHGAELSEFLRRAETVLVPVLPSPVDINAARRFLDELRSAAPVKNRQTKVGLIANRVMEHTRIAGVLEHWLGARREHLVATLRETQNYVRASAEGRGIVELPPYIAWQDWAQWDPITAWLSSRRSLPS